VHFGHFTGFPAGTGVGVFSVTPQSAFGHLYETDIDELRDVICPHSRYPIRFQKDCTTKAVTFV